MTHLTPNHIDSEADLVEEALLRVLDVETALSMTVRPGNQRLVSEREFAEIAGIHPKIARSWRNETLKTGKLVGPPWCLIKTGRNTLVAYMASDILAFLKSYVTRTDVGQLDPQMDKVYLAVQEEFDRHVRGAGTDSADSFFTMSGNSPPAADRDQGGAS